MCCYIIDCFHFPARAVTKHIVCLTFDFDGISGFVARGSATPTPVSRGEFGPRVGAPRLLALLRKHRIKSSWYVPGHTIETFPAAVKAVVDQGHEIGHHGWQHVSPVALSQAEEEAELVRGEPGEGGGWRDDNRRLESRIANETSHCPLP